MSYKQNELTEEIFGHLCNVALSKCSDKSEKKRAGCGGRAMRKRVLIKNFVSDLFKMPKKPATNREHEMASSDEEYDDYDMSEVTFYEEDIEEFRLEELTGYDHRGSTPDVWLQPYTGPEMSGFNTHSPYTSSYDAFPTSNSYEYDMYGSSMSESATEGDMPLASDPLGSLSAASNFDAFGTSTANRSTSSFYADDDFFMSTLADHSVFSEPQPMALSTTSTLISEDTHELTDLDVATGESHANKNKRRSTELFDEFNVQFQKRIKI